MAGAYTTERISPSPLLSYSDDSPSYRQNVGLKLCVSVSPTTGQRGASRVGASWLGRTSRKRQHEKCNARTCRWQVNDVYGTFFPMKLTCADAIKSKQTHVSAGMLPMTLWSELMKWMTLYYRKFHKGIRKKLGTTRCYVTLLWTFPRKYTEKLGTMMLWNRNETLWLRSGNLSA